MNSNFRPEVRLTDDVMYLVNKQLEKSIKKKARDAVNRHDIANYDEYRRENPDIEIKFENSLWFRSTKVTILRGPENLTEIEKAVMNRVRNACVTLEVNDELMETLIEPRVGPSLEWQNFVSVARTVIYYWQKCLWPRVPSVPFLQLPESLFEDESESGLLFDLTVNRRGKRLLDVERLLKCVLEWEVTGSPVRRAPDRAEWKATFENKKYSGRSVIFALWLFLYLVPRVSEVPDNKTNFFYDCKVYAYVNQDQANWSRLRGFPPPRPLGWKFVFTSQCRF